MRISLEWLGEWLDLTGIAPDDLAEALTGAGLEVEAIERIEPAFAGVRLARIEAVQPHPNADRLRLVTVDVGDDKPQVVCGAPNVRPGLWVAFAPQGARVLGRDGQPFTLAQAVIRGVPSCGMICSLPELGLHERYAQDEDGIWVLDALASGHPPGACLAGVLGLSADVILDTAPTANRGDLMSMFGVSREAAALLNRPIAGPATRQTVSALTPVPVCQGLSVRLDHPDVCAYYGGVLLSGLTLGPSPAWLVRRLEAAGVRAINNLVDITNYVMLALGQPLHAFDADALGTQAVIGVRRARAGETLHTLDDVSRALTGDSVVITANDAPVALAGLMGGASSEIRPDSSRLFLEAAVFPAASSRRSAKSVGLRTEASARFERGVDPTACREALFYAVSLYQTLAGARVEGFVESPPPEDAPQRLVLRLARVEATLGVAVSRDTVVSILEKLGFDVASGPDDGVLHVSCPAYRRQDVTREIDLIEEVARIVGYAQTPQALAPTVRAAARTPRQQALETIRRSLTACGLQEVVTNSLIGEALLEKTGVSVDAARLVRVSNSQSRDHTLLRQSLLPTLLEVMRANLAQGAEAVWIAETGRTYFRQDEPTARQSGVAEPLTIGVLITGQAQQGAWHLPDATRQPDFYTLKGIAEALLAALRIADVRFEPASDIPTHHPGKTARLFDAQGRALGLLGELHPHSAQRLKCRQPVYTMELDGEALLRASALMTHTPCAPRLSSYPAVTRDMAFSAPDAVSHQQILDRLQAVGEPLLTGVSLFDEYRGEQAGAGRRSLAYRLTLQSHDETLDEARIEAAVTRIRERLRDDLAVTFR